MSKVQTRVTCVLRRLENLLDNDDDAEIIAEELETWLNDLLHDDFFGTEGQTDPRGDFRNGQWSMTRVEGIDTMPKSRAGVDK